MDRALLLIKDIEIWGILLLIEALLVIALILFVAFILFVAVILVDITEARFLEFIVYTPRNFQWLRLWFRLHNFFNIVVELS